MAVYSKKRGSSVTKFEGQWERWSKAFVQAKTLGLGLQCSPNYHPWSTSQPRAPPHLLLCGVVHIDIKQGAQVGQVEDSQGPKEQV